MFRIEEVTTKKQRKQFVDFVVELYKGCPQYVPQLRGDEMRLATPKENPAFEKAHAKYFLVYDEADCVVGRMCAMVQFGYNEKVNKKYLRFTRMDFIDDKKVSKLLYDKMVELAKAEGMEYIHGPLGFSDFDQEGLVVEGYDTTPTASNVYHYEYYKKHLEELGFEKEVDWLEFKIAIPTEVDEKYFNISKIISEKYHLKEAAIGTKSQIIKNYGVQLFELLDRCYGDLHGFVPVDDKTRDNLIDAFAMAADPRFMSIICNEEGKMIGLGLCLSSLSEALKKNKGRLFPFGFVPVLQAIKNPKILELAFIAIDEEYRNKGVNAMIMAKIIPACIENKIVYAESNCQLEDNVKIRAFFKNFDMENHRRRRCYVKKI
ncbi:MAG: GNAT family N-acetyltransferase [Clostridia bacterium]